jgi:hypothetical protein
MFAKDGRAFVFEAFSLKIHQSKCQRLQNEVFHLVRKLPTQIGLDCVRNSEPKFSCFGPFKKGTFLRPT